MSRTRSWALIAHRGASAVAPESTRAAIRGAVRAGADHVELDVRMTRDHRLIAFHDERLERTTDGTGRVAQRRYAEIAKLDAGSWFHRRFAGERVLLVSQAARVMPARVRIHLELKRTRQPRLLQRRLLRLIRSRGLTRRVMISSFDPAVLRLFVGHGVGLALLCARQPQRSLRWAAAIGCEAWHLVHTLARPSAIARAHALGLRVHVWTVDDPRRARQCLRWGADGLFTNDPGRLRRHLG